MKKLINIVAKIKMKIQNFIKKDTTCACDACGKIHNITDMNIISCEDGAGVVLVLCKKCKHEDLI